MSQETEKPKRSKGCVAPNKVSLEGVCSVIITTLQGLKPMPCVIKLTLAELKVHSFSTPCLILTPTAWRVFTAYWVFIAVTLLPVVDFPLTACTYICFITDNHRWTCVDQFCMLPGLTWLHLISLTLAYSEIASATIMSFLITHSNRFKMKSKRTAVCLFNNRANHQNVLMRHEGKISYQIERTLQCAG